MALSLVAAVSRSSSTYPVAVYLAPITAVTLAAAVVWVVSRRATSRS